MDELLMRGRDRRRFMACSAGALAASATPWSLATTMSPPIAPAGGWNSKTAKVRDLDIHYVEHGKGPLVLLCHGFPESWYSWRHQIPALAAAGYRVVVPDLRGFGGTGGSKALAGYTMPSLVADLTGLMDALGEKTTVLVGHDFGASLSWHATLLAPERVKAIAALSVPYTPRGGDAPPTVRMKRAVGDMFFYVLYFQTPGVAEAELEPDIPRFLRASYYSGSAQGMTDPALLALRQDRPRYLENLIVPKELPAWISEADLRYYADRFARHGLTGPLNWYRNLDTTWELMKPFTDAKVEHPALFITGEHDLLLRTQRASFDRLSHNVPGLQRSVTLPNCGHFIQQECPAEVNRELLAFLKKVA